MILILFSTTAWCQVYKDPLIVNGQSRSAASYVRPRHYHKPRERYGFLGMTTGVWQPRGNNNVLGYHPSIGMVFGAWSDRFMWEFEMEFRFTQAAHQYRVIYRDTLQSTRQYFGGFIGLHCGYGILNFKSTTVYIMGGLGYDGFDSLDKNDPDELYSVEINSLNLNAGLGIQHFPKAGGYWGIELLYNRLNYTNPGGTPLDGNALTFRFSYGFIGKY